MLPMHLQRGAATGSTQQVGLCAWRPSCARVYSRLLCTVWQADAVQPYMDLNLLEVVQHPVLQTLTFVGHGNYSICCCHYLCFASSPQGTHACRHGAVSHLVLCHAMHSLLSPRSLRALLRCALRQRRVAVARERACTATLAAEGLALDLLHGRVCVRNWER